MDPRELKYVAAWCHKSSKLMVVEGQQVSIVSKPPKLDRLPHILCDDPRSSLHTLIMRKLIVRKPPTSSPTSPTSPTLLRNRESNPGLKRSSDQSTFAITATARNSDLARIDLGLLRALQGVDNPTYSPGPSCES